jgi:N-acetyl-anhydromuramyl-L-alanine amidase AmpD
MSEFDYPFRQAYYYDPRLFRDPLWIVIHCTAVHEHPDYAEDLGEFFSRPRGDGQQVSAHFGCDNNSTVQYVHTRDVAFCARRTGNEYGIHIELSGTADQTREQWLDPFGQGLLNQAAVLCSRLMRKYNIPQRWLPDDVLRAKTAKGFTTHEQLTRVFGGTHTDPGPNFPKDHLFARITAEFAGDGDMQLKDRMDMGGWSAEFEDIIRQIYLDGKAQLKQYESVLAKLDRIIELLTPKDTP